MRRFRSGSWPSRRMPATSRSARTSDARLWSQSKTDQVYVLDTGRGGAEPVLQFSPDGRYLLAGNQSAGLSLWNIDQRHARRPPARYQGDTLAASFSPDGNLLLTAVLNGKVSLWNLVQVTRTDRQSGQLDSRHAADSQRQLDE